MIPANLLPYLQIAVGCCLVAWAVALIAVKVRDSGWRFPRFARGQTNDLRVLIDMAARFRDAGNVAAVTACQALIDELLKPKT